MIGAGVKRPCSIFGVKMTDCTKCGACCEDIMLSFNPEDIPDQFKNSESPTVQQDVEFIGNHWTVKAGDSFTGYTAKCDMYDSESKLCTAHELRPPVCQGYPWYKDEPSLEHRNARLLPPQCSFTKDIRNLLPLFVL